MMRLIVPQAIRGCVSVRNDALDAKTGCGQQRFELFIRKIGNDVGQEVRHVYHCESAGPRCAEKRIVRSSCSPESCPFQPP